MKSFEKFLNDKNCSIQEIKNYLENIIDTKNNFVCLYSSHMDNLGNSESDIDVYVFSASLVREDYFKVENYIISGLNLDIEYRNIEFLKTLIDKYKSVISTPAEINVFDLKLIQRVKSSLKLNTDVLCAENELLRLLSELDIKNNVSNYYSYLARSDYDDGIRMFNSQNFIASRECLRKAVIYQAGAINSVYGSINLKEKWISTIFLGLNQVENMDIVPMYLKNIVYEEVTEKNIESVCKSLILLYQMMVSEVAFNS